jgi:hypothetical protein
MHRIKYPNGINDGIPVLPDIHAPLHMFTMSMLHEPKVKGFTSLHLVIVSLNLDTRL